MFDFITFGSATWDIFVRDKEIGSEKDRRFVTGKNIYFSLGSKIEIDELKFSTGGGGTNSAATFLSQGFKVAFCGSVGNDPAGSCIVDELSRKGADVSLVLKTPKKPTNHSLIFSVPGKDRTIFTYKGASDFLPFKEFSSRIKSKWFYIAPLSGKSAKYFDLVVDFAKKNNTKVAANMGNSQLFLPKKKIEKILKKINILILNQEEASILSGVDYKNEKRIVEEVGRIFGGVFVMTKGSRGLVVADGKKIYSAGVMKSKVVDRTGAGDSFGAGFVAEFSRSEDVQKAIEFGSANATSCLSSWGAKNGLLKKDERYKKIKVFSNEIAKHN